MPQIVSHLFRRIIADVLAQLLVILGVRLDVLAVGQALLDDRVEQRVQHRHVAPGIEAQGRRRVPHQGMAARVHDKHLGAALGRLLEEGGGDRVVLGRPRADDDDDVGIQRRGERAPSPRPSRSPPSRPRPTRRGTAGCSDRHCCCQSRCAPASGTGRPPRSTPWPSRSRRAPACRHGRGCARDPGRRGRALPPSSPCGNACTGWPGRYRCRASTPLPCGSSGSVSRSGWWA